MNAEPATALKPQIPSGNATSSDLPPRPEIMNAALEEHFQCIAEMTDIDYELRRDMLADNVGIRVSFQDAERQKRRPQAAAADSISIFPSDMPAVDAVDGAALLARIAATFRRFVALPKHADTVLALWTLHTYAFETASHTPIIALTSPTPRCGKTTTEAVMIALANHALPASNVTSATVFRAVEKWHPTLIIDEADSFLRDNEELRGILNSGHSRGTAFVLRSVGDDFEPKRFSTWCPKMIALIGKLPPTLADRAIEIKLRRRLPSETVARFRPDKFDGAIARSMILRWVADHRSELETEAETPPSLNDRAADNWRALLTIAAVAGGPWPEKAKAAALALSGDAEDETAGIMLLADVIELFQCCGSDYLASSEIVEHLAGMEARPWPEWHRGKPISVRQLARLLSGFEIIPTTHRFGEKTAKGYSRAQFDDASARYTYLQSVTTSQPNNGAASGQNSIRNMESNVTDEKTRKPRAGAACDGVTDGIPRPKQTGMTIGKSTMPDGIDI